MNSMPSIDSGRRRWLTAIGALVASGAGFDARAETFSHDPFGPVLPAKPAPPLTLKGDDGAAFELTQRLRGTVTAVQLMFTGCSATCPIQGALFAQVARMLPARGRQLLSLSIDPRNDDAAKLRRWRRQFDAGAGAPLWQAAAPRVEDLDGLLAFLRGRSKGVDQHAGSVWIFDRGGRLSFRTAELPPAEEVAAAMDAVSRQPVVTGNR